MGICKIYYHTCHVFHARTLHIDQRIGETWMESKADGMVAVYR